MNAAKQYSTSTPRNLERVTTTEELLRYGMSVLGAAGVYVSPSKMSRIVRKWMRVAGPSDAKRALDDYLDNTVDKSWEKFELWVNNHTDPTAAEAVRRLNAANATDLIITRRLAAEAVTR